MSSILIVSTNAYPLESRKSLMSCSVPSNMSPAWFISTEITEGPFIYYVRMFWGFCLPCKYLLTLEVLFCLTTPKFWKPPTYHIRGGSTLRWFFFFFWPPTLLRSRRLVLVTSSFRPSKLIWRHKHEPPCLRWHFLWYERWQKVDIFGPPTYLVLSTLTQFKPTAEDNENIIFDLQC